ncbi:TetR family transcriptional regulator [Mycobacterium paraffinicum]|uniref:TetR family transcriptional regulator n=1 Tax=Mycobacterium paraffinicum TaxID=53378 RepID=A0A1Q4HX06_9MYCO|nr:TetR/AcrR family transcriptional regulator [Mycobacterium paraffinicum]OJZ74237.1 TetR family transcriptional regulator [Mycobacterium paraffinicum]
MTTAKTDTRQTILDTAERLMVQKGYSAVGLTEVLTTAGVPKGSFYHYFNSRDAFGEAMLQNYFTGYLANMNRIIATPGASPAQQLMTYWQQFYDKQTVDECQGRCLVVKLAAEVSDLSEPMRLILQQGTAGILERLERMLAAGIEDGSVSLDVTPAVAANTLYSAWIGASVLAKVNRSPEQLDTVMAYTRQMLNI